MSSPEPEPESEPEPEVDVVVVGAGFGGLYALHRLRSQGLRVRLYERGSGVGGTWFWNRYPGARCDVESMDYCYSFSPELQREWNWTERYPSQPEILRYLEHVAERFDLYRDIRLGVLVTSATYEEASNIWRIDIDPGETVTTRFCVMASGTLSAARDVGFDGLESFGGAVYRTGEWPQAAVSFAGQRVGVVGTGSSGIQCIPEIAREADAVVVFQRTANFSVPARNGALDPDTQRAIKETYRERRERARRSFSGVAWRTDRRPASEVSPDERWAEYQARWEEGGAGFLAAYPDLMTDSHANESAAEFVRDRIRSIVRDPDIAERLVPRGFAIGSRRLCVDTGYYETFNRDNVTLVDVGASPIVAVTETGVRTVDSHFELDAIVLATGFDAITGALLRIDIRGTGGLRLNDKWASGPRTYLGLMTAGFPNLFMLTGPGSPSVLSNMVLSIEQHVEWVADCIGYMQAEGADVIEATTEAEERWVSEVAAVANATLFPTAPASWYLGSNVPGKARVFMPYVGGVGRYRQICEEVAASGYDGFSVRRSERGSCDGPAPAKPDSARKESNVSNRPAGVRLDRDEAWTRIEAAHTGIFTSLRRDGVPIALPVWFVTDEHSIIIRTPGKTKKVSRVRHNPVASFLIEDGLRWVDLTAVHFTGRAEVLEPLPADAEAFNAKFSDKYDAFELKPSKMPESTKEAYTRRGDVVFIRFLPDDRMVAFDNGRLGIG